MINITANNFDVGLAIIVNQHERHEPMLNLTKEWFEAEVFSIADQTKPNFVVFPMDLKKFKFQQKKGVRTQDQMALSDLNESLHWLWFYCRHPPSTPYRSSIVIQESSTSDCQRANTV